MLTFKPISQSHPPSSCQGTIVDYFSQLSKLLHHLLVIIKPRPNRNCPSYLLPAVPSRGKQKTGICRRTTSPRWEQTIVWEDLSMEEVKYKFFYSDHCLFFDSCGNMRMKMMPPGDGEEFGAGDLGPRPDWQDPRFPRRRQVCISLD